MLPAYALSLDNIVLSVIQEFQFYGSLQVLLAKTVNLSPVLICTLQSEKQTLKDSVFSITKTVLINTSDEYSEIDKC